MEKAPDEEVQALAAQNGRKHRFITALTVLFFPLAIGLWVELAEPTNVGPLLFWGAIAVIAIIQLIAFLMDRPPEDIAPTLFLTVRHQREKIGELQTLDAYRRTEMQFLTSALVLGKSWSAIQSHLPIFFAQRDSDIREACERIVEPMTGELKQLFGMDLSDVWSIAVYKWDAGVNLLQPVYLERARNHPSQDAEPRSWRDGEGHSGTAFMAQQILFTSDVAQPSTLNRVYPTPENLRSYDLETYRSFVTVPLVVTDQNDTRHRLGVVALTSNQVGRFDETNAMVVEQLGEVLAEALWLSRCSQLAVAEAK